MVTVVQVNNRSPITHVRVRKSVAVEIRRSVLALGGGDINTDPITVPTYTDLPAAGTPEYTAITADSVTVLATEIITLGEYIKRMSQ